MTISSIASTAQIRGRLGRLKNHEPLLWTAVLILLPWVLPYHALATNILIYGLFAMGFNLVFGQMGLLSFGHAAFFGCGAYATGAILLRFPTAGLLAFAAAGTSAALLALVIGFFATKSRGIYLAMITLALGQCVYFVASHTEELTGGENGLRGVDLKGFLLFDKSLNFANRPLTKYFVFLGIVLLVGGWLWRLRHSPFGTAVDAVRENESRAKACGYDTTLIKLITFTISGLVCGVAGAMKGIHLGIVPLETLSLNTAALVILMTLIGGMGTFTGPFVGAAIMLGIEDGLSTYTEYWQMASGLLFVLCVLFFPGGIVGTVSRKIRVRP